MQDDTEFENNLATGVLLIGEYATGKTSWALEWPNPYLYDADNNLAGAVRRAKLRGIKFKYDVGVLLDKDKIKDDNVNILPGDRYETMVARLKIAFADPNITTVIIDSCSAVSEFIIAYILKAALKTEMSIPLWGEYLKVWKNFITWSRSQKKPVIFTAHENYEKDEADQTFKYSVLIQGQMQKRIGSYFSDIYRLEIQNKPTQGGGSEPVYVCRTKPTAQIRLRCSFPNMPTVFPTSEIKHIYEGLGLPTPDRK